MTIHRLTSVRSELVDNDKGLTDDVERLIRSDNTQNRTRKATSGLMEQPYPAERVAVLERF